MFAGLGFWCGRAAGAGRGVGIGIGVLDERTRSVDLGRIHHRPLCRRQPAAGNHEGRTAQVADFADFFALGQPVSQLDHSPLGIAKNQHVGFGVGQHGTAYLVRPVIVVGNPAQAGFNRTDDDIAAGTGFTAALGVNGDSVIRALVGFGIGRIGIVGACFTIRGVAIHHRIHVAGGDPEKQVRLAQTFEILGRIPVRLADDADAETLRLEQAPDQRHAEAGMIDIGVAGDEDYVAGIPAQGLHFLTGHRQKGGRAKAVSPEFSVAEKRRWCLSN
ncbi:MAG: hypothetical protein ACD_10C00530G0003 [uncultured bacterium]|nr:MAG: hypothetical protein ACD_10C00530G0003 [uncultured bacterium]